MFGNERDIEVPALVRFVAHHRPGSLLDVGAHYSHSHYAWRLRELVKTYHAIDVVDDPRTAAIVDDYCIGNVLGLHPDINYDCVLAVSTLEHCGLSTYQVEDHGQERDDVFRKCIGLATRYVWLSFPVGLPYALPGQFANITEDTLQRWTAWATEAGWEAEQTFYYLNDDNQTYREVEAAVALNHEYDLSRIQQSFCIMTLVREAWWTTT